MEWGSEVQRVRTSYTFYMGCVRQVQLRAFLGLNNAIGSADPERALRVARQLRSGCVMINTTAMAKDAPFGGYKQSGNAREWGSYGIDEFLVMKQVSGV